MKFNALNLNGNTPKCDIPTEVISTGNTNIDIKNEVFSNLLEPLKEANENNGFYQFTILKIIFQRQI